MNMKRLVLSALILGLLVWGLTELYRWLVMDLVGNESIARIAPGLAGATLGTLISIFRQKRERFLNQSGIQPDNS